MNASYRISPIVCYIGTADAVKSHKECVKAEKKYKMITLRFTDKKDEIDMVQNLNGDWFPCWVLDKAGFWEANYDWARMLLDELLEQDPVMLQTLDIFSVETFDSSFPSKPATQSAIKSQK